MGITVYVLARIIRDRQAITFGNHGPACAAVDDVSAWCILAVVIAVAKPLVLLELSSLLVSRRSSW